MKGKFKISLLSAFAMLLAISVAAGNAVDAFHVPGGGWGVASLIFLKSLMGGAMHGHGHWAGVQVEIWENHIEGNLFKDNEFILDTVDESQYALAGKVIHIPQAGAKANIQVNRSSLPATVVQRTDTDITYNMDVYTSDPILIDNAESVELSYDKRESVLMEHQESLNQTIADYLIVKWSPATNIIRTTGIPNNDTTQAPVAVAAHLTGATGSRLKFGLYDLKAIKLKLDKANVSPSDRFGLLDADMYSQLVDDIILSKYRESSLLFDANEGVIRGKIMGFKIHMRSSASIYDNSATPVVKAYGAAAAATDNAAGLFWQKNALARAKGPTKFFQQEDAPQYYGNVYSFLQRMGGRIRRTGEENIVAIVQAAA
jgi:hypothetical protein